MIGLIGSSIVSGLIVSRTGHYKWLIVGSVAVMGFAVFLMTNLTVDTPVPWCGCGCSSPAWASDDILGAHDRHPERRAVPAARRRDLEPHVLPPDRRHDCTGIRGNDLRVDVPGAAPDAIPAAGVPPSVLHGLRAAAAAGNIDANVLTGVGDVGAGILRSWLRPDR